MNLDALRGRDPRELIKFVDGEPVGFGCCLCKDHGRHADDSQIYREEHADWCDWYAEAVRVCASRGQRRVLVREFEMYLSRDAELPGWMPRVPDGMRPIKHGPDAWLARRIAWDFPELYEPLRRVWRAQPCVECGYETSECDEDMWRRIISLVEEGSSLAAAQDAVLSPSRVPGFAYQFRLLKAMQGAERSQHARTRRIKSMCALCGEWGYIGQVNPGEVVIQTEHGIPREEWPRFFDRPHSEREDTTTAVNNLWNACRGCNGNKGQQTLFEFMLAAGASVRAAASQETIVRVLEFELDRRRSPAFSRAIQGYTGPDPESWRKIGMEI